MRIVRGNIFIKIIYNFLGIYPSPSNFNVWWNFGSMGLFFLIIQIITGIILGMFYVPDADLAFNSIDYIMREVHYVDWLDICMLMEHLCFFL